MDIQNIIKNLENEGYKNIFIHKDLKDTYYDWHKHPFEEVRIIIEGKLKINTKTKTFILKKGDRLNVPKNEEHEAYVLEDTTYICGSKY